MSNKNTKWILVESEAEVGTLKKRVDLIGFDFYAVELAKDDLVDLLKSITLKKQYRLGTFLRNEYPDGFQAYLQALSNVGAHNPDPLWQAYEVAAKTGQGQLALVCSLAASVGHLSFEKGIILANLSRSSIEVLAAAIQNAGFSVEVVSKRYTFRDTNVFKLLKFAKNSFKHVVKWSKRIHYVKNTNFSTTLTVPQDATVIRSYFFKNSVNGGHFNDIYFQPLLEKFRRDHTPYVHWCSLYDADDSTIQSIDKLAAGTPIRFLESYLRNADVLFVVFSSVASILRSYLWIRNNPIYVRGVNVTPAVWEDLFAEWCSGQNFVPLLNYIAGKKFALVNPNVKILYPFENLTWERMMLTGLKAGSKLVTTMGHQHSLLVPCQMYVQLAPGECNHLPLPDKIIATGPRAVEALQKAMHLPQGRIVSGCALRGSTPSANVKKPRPLKLNILVVLNTVLDAVSVVRLLKDMTFDLEIIARVQMRFHPLFTYEEVSRYVDVPTRFPFAIHPNQTLSESLQSADVVIYSGSTVGIEAILKHGIPALCLDIDSLIDRDPLGDKNSLKFKADSASSLSTTLNHIWSNWDALVHHDAQVEGVSQTLEFFASPDEPGLSKFASCVSYSPPLTGTIAPVM